MKVTVIKHYNNITGYLSTDLQRFFCFFERFDRLFFYLFERPLFDLGKMADFMDIQSDTNTGGYDTDSESSSKFLSYDDSSQKEPKKRKLRNSQSPTTPYLDALMSTPRTVIRQKMVPAAKLAENKPPPQDVLIISSKDTKLADENPIKIQKCLSSTHGVVKNIRPTRNGDIVVKCMDYLQCRAILNSNKLGDWSISCYKPQSLNTSQGCIYNVSSERTVEEFKYALSDYGVINVIRMTRYDSNSKSRVPSNTLKITFNQPHLPPTVCIGFSEYKVKLYVPKAIQCFNCQSFGHMANSCKKAKVCVKCSKNHEGACIEIAPLCANCKGNHTASYKDCPKRIEKQTMIKISREEKISVSEASQQVKTVNKKVKNMKAKKATNVTTEIKGDVKNKDKMMSVTQVVTLLSIVMGKLTKTPQQRLHCDNITNFLTKVLDQLYNYWCDIDSEQIIQMFNKCEHIEI